MLRVLLLGCACLAAAPASAAVMQATITGTVDYAYDENDLVFGGAVSVGASFMLTYVYDTEAGEITENVGPPASKLLNGGSWSNLPAVVSASLATAGYSFATTGASQGYVQLSESSWTRYISRDSPVIGSTISDDMLDLYAYGTLPFDFESEFTFTPDPAASEYLTGQLLSLSYIAGASENLYNAQLILAGDKLVVERIDDVDPPSAVPLPATGLLLLGAVGAVSAFGPRRTA